jgi:hypothetical protein
MSLLSGIRHVLQLPDDDRADPRGVQILQQVGDRVGRTELRTVVTEVGVAVGREQDVFRSDAVVGLQQRLDHREHRRRRSVGLRPEEQHGPEPPAADDTTAHGGAQTEAYK